MGNLNKIMLIGKLGADAEIRQVGQGSVAEFRLATSERWKKADGTLGEETTWHTVQLWNQPGVHQFLTKGREIYVEGSYKSKDWQDQQGGKHRDYYVKAITIQLVGPNPQAQQQAPMAPVQPQYQQPMQPQYQPQPQAPQYAQPQPPMPPQYQQPQPPMPPQYPQPGQPGNQQYPPMNSPAYTQPQSDDLPL